LLRPSLSFAFQACLAAIQAIAYWGHYAPDHRGATVIVNLSGRGDKDLHIVLEEGL